MDKPTLQQLDKAFSEYVNGWGRAKDFVEAVVKQWWYTMEELWNPVFDNEWNLTSNDYNKWWDEQSSNEAPDVKEDTSSKEDVENKEKPETEVDNEKIKQLKEEQASIDAKAYADEWRKEYEDNLTKEEWDETSGKSKHSWLQFWDAVAWDLSKYAPLLYSYFEKNPWEAAKLIEKVKDVNTLWEAKLLNFFDNLWGRLLYWMDKWNGSFKSSVIWTDKVNPFQWWNKSSEIKEVTRAIWKTNSDNPWILNKSVWTVSKNSNAYSNLTTLQKIQWWLQLFWMAMAALDWWLKVSDDMDSWVMKEDSNEFIERLYMFSNYLDKSLTDMIPGVWLGNAIYNVVMENKKDENWLSKGRWGLLTKLWLDFWTEKDADKRKQNKDAVDWMQDEWYTKNWVPIYNRFKPASTGKWTPARFAEEQAKAIEKMQTMWWTDQYWNTADNAATRYIVQYNKASWNKSAYSNKWQLSSLTKSDMLKNYKWKKQDDWSYDWVNKKTWLSLANEVQWLSKSTWNKYPTFEEDNANREKWKKIQEQKEENKKNWRNLINWTKEKMKEKYNPWDTINI